MKVPAIKALVEKYSIFQLIEAEAALYEEQAPEIEIEGDDEGEQLTHVLAAIWIKKDMEQNGTDVRTSLRNYTVKVRNSIN